MYHQSVKQFGSRSGPTYCCILLGLIWVQIVCKGHSVNKSSHQHGRRLSLNYMEYSWESCRYEKQTWALIHLCGKDCLSVAFWWKYSECRHWRLELRKVHNQGFSYLPKVRARGLLNLGNKAFGRSKLGKLDAV